LSFEPTGITVIYGDNGVGKSGYARILKRACRARLVGELLPNAFDPTPTQTQSATIAYNAGNVAAPAIRWVNDGKPHPILSAISVFDRDSGAVHVRSENEVAFRPFGLDIPDELAGVCQAVKAALAAEQDKLASAQDGVFINPTFSSTSPVGKILSSLTATTSADGSTRYVISASGKASRMAVTAGVVKTTSPMSRRRTRRIFIGCGGSAGAPALVTTPAAWNNSVS